MGKTSEIVKYGISQKKILGIDIRCLPSGIISAKICLTAVYLSLFSISAYSDDGLSNTKPKRKSKRTPVEHVLVWH